MRKTLGTMLRFAMVAVVCGTVSAQSQISCPNMPAAMTDVNRQVRSDVQATVGSLSKLKLGELVARTEVETQALLAKYPNVDRLLTVQMMAATHCSILVSSNLPATEKLQRWERFAETAYRFVDPSRRPALAQSDKPQTAPTPTAQARPEQRGTGSSHAVSIPPDVEDMWVFYQTPGVESQSGCTRPINANPIKPTEVARRMSEFVEYAKTNRVQLIFVAKSRTRGYVGAAEDMRIDGRPLKRETPHWCDDEKRYGYWHQL
ncbi:MAG: hypothetical protein WCF44_20060 [Candidatus Methylophosphatis roskildensis]